MPERSSKTPRPSYLIGRLHRVLRQTLDDRMRTHGLTAAQYAALSILGAQPGLSNAQLARRSFMTAQSAHQTLQALQRMRLVRREQDPMHARIARTELTARGKTVLQACERAVDEVEKAMLAGMPGDVRKRLIGDLRVCLQAVDPSYGG
jgi:DNA-binding MarR family transcriptional regulator